MKRYRFWFFVSPFFLPFVLSLNFYPEVDFFKQFSGFLLSVVFAVFVMSNAKLEYKVSRALIVWAALGAAWALSYWFSSPAVMQSAFAYLSFWFCGALIFISIP